MPKKSSPVVSTRLRIPTPLHRMLDEAAKRNMRSLNSEILWCIAQQLGGEASKYVEEMAAEQQRVLADVLETLMADPQKFQEALAKATAELNAKRERKK